MTKAVEVVQCGRQIGTKASPELYGTCTKEPGHPSSRGGFHGCSSPLLRQHMRDAAAKSRAKAKRLKETPAPIDDSILEETDDDLCSSCGRKRSSCADPKFCDMLASIPITPPRVVAEQERLKAEEDARRAAGVNKRNVAGQFITEVLDRHEAGQVIDRQTESKYIEACIILLHLPGDLADKFRLDRDGRLRRGFNENGIGERYLSSVCYGPEYEGFHAPAPLDEHSLRVKLGRFLGVMDSRGCTRYLASTHPPSVPDVPLVSPVVRP